MNGVKEKDGGPEVDRLETDRQTQGQADVWAPKLSCSLWCLIFSFLPLLAFFLDKWGGQSNDFPAFLISGNLFAFIVFVSLLFSPSFFVILFCLYFFSSVVLFFFLKNICPFLLLSCIAFVPLFFILFIKSRIHSFFMFSISGTLAMSIYILDLSWFFCIVTVSFPFFFWNK